MSKVVGIDLGTTNSCVAILEGGKTTVIANAEGERTTPSIVGFIKDGSDRIVGSVAKRQAVRNPLNTVFSIKRFIGRRWSETEEERRRVPYQVSKGKDSTVEVSITTKEGTREYTSQEISSMILQKLKQDAEAYLGESVEKAVITVPAYFTDAQRQATKDAGMIAGLEVLRIVNEPTAAALAYGLDKLDQEQLILVFDLGGGTFDVSVLQLGDGIFEVRATAGNNHLGGDDFDACLVNWLIQEFKTAEGIDLTEDRAALQRLREAAEKAKIELSSVSQTEINLPFITATQDGPKHLDVSLARAKFEELCSDLIDRCRIPVENAIRDAKIDKSKLDEVVLVGGSTRIPAVQELVKKVLGKDPNQGVNPDEVVAVGAAIQAGVLAGEVKDILLLDVTPLSLGVETLGGVMTKIIPRNTTIPTKKSETFSTAVDGQSNVELHVLQGEREMGNDNKSLGTFRLDGIPAAPRGVPQIEVTFDIDANGILAVKAKDKGTGKEQSITITGASTLPDNEVERMVKEAERNSTEDKLKRDKVEAKNQADSLAYQAEKQLADLGDKVPAADKTKIEDLIKELKSAIASEDHEKIKTATEELKQALYALSTSVYQQGAGDTSGMGDDNVQDSDRTKDAASGDDSVIDADFTEESK